MTTRKRLCALLVLLVASLLASCSTYDETLEGLEVVKIRKDLGAEAAAVMVQWWASLPADENGELSALDVVTALPALYSGVSRFIDRFGETEQPPQPEPEPET